MQSSNDVYEFMKKAGFEFPKGCREIYIKLVHGEMAEAHIVHTVQKGGKFVIDGDKVKTETRRLRFCDPDRPVICSCCGRYVKWAR